MTQTTNFFNRQIDKKAAYILISVVSILIIVIAIFTFLFQANNPSNTSQQNLPAIKITDFLIDNRWSYVGGLLMDCSFNLTIENKGAVNVTGAVLAVRMFNNSTEIQLGNYFDGTYENGTITNPLEPGDIRVFRGTIMSSVGDEAYQNLGLNGTSLIASVSLKCTVLDQRKIE